MASRITDGFIIKAQGEMAGHTTTAAPFTSVKGAHWAKFKAGIANPGNVTIGRVGVTAMANTTTSTAGWPLDAGQETDWIMVPSGDLANMYYISDNSTDSVAYMVA